MRKIITHPFFRNSAIMFAGTMLTNVLAYLYHLVVGRILGPVGYGELAALISIFYILNAPSMVVQNILVKFFTQLKAKNDHGQAKRLFLRISRLLLFIEIGVFLLMVPLLGKFASFLHIHDRLNLIWLYLMFASFIFTIVNVSALQAYQKFVAISAVNALGGIIRLGFGTIGAFFGVGLALFSNVIAGIATYLATYIPLKTLLSYKEHAITLSPANAFLYSVPTFVAVFSVTALYSQDVILVKHFFDPQQAGLYSSLSVLGKIIYFASSSLGFVAFPMLAERKELGKPYGIIVLLSLGIVALISFGLTLFYYLFPALVVNLLFGEAFTSVSHLLGPFGLFISLYTLCNLTSTMYIALGKTKIWIFTVIAAITQAVFISMQHSSLSIVIWNNTLVVGALLIVLLLYYPYANRKE